jgi:CheY-like chemotaxis protein
MKGQFLKLYLIKHKVNKPFILCLIDNDEVYQYTVTRSLKAHVLTKKILVFSDGEQALWFLIDNVANNENLPDIIFLDINMPVMDGWQFLEEYIKLKPRMGKVITIYMITSSLNTADIERSKRISEISDYIVKPIMSEMLKGIIENLERTTRS